MNVSFAVSYWDRDLQLTVNETMKHLFNFPILVFCILSTFHVCRSIDTSYEHLYVCQLV
jgi:hypothetical protein